MIFFKEIVSLKQTLFPILALSETTNYSKEFGKKHPFKLLLPYNLKPFSWLKILKSKKSALTDKTKPNNVVQT